MELATSVYIREMPVERFLYLKSIFVLKEIEIRSACGSEWLTGKFEGLVQVTTEWFPKGKYTL